MVKNFGEINLSLHFTAPDQEILCVIVEFYDLLADLRQNPLALASLTARGPGMPPSDIIRIMNCVHIIIVFCVFQ
jgi:hypothetical protein